jgi:hypothetical protein
MRLYLYNFVSYSTSWNCSDREYACHIWASIKPSRQQRKVTFSGIFVSSLLFASCWCIIHNKTNDNTITWVIYYGFVVLTVV